MTTRVNADEAEAASLASLDATPTLARQTLTYAVSGVIGPALSAILLPVFARVFSRSEYGLLELGMTLATIALALAELSLIAAAQRSYFDYGDEQRTERRRVLSTALLVTTTLTLGAAALLVVFREPVSDWLFGSDEHGNLVAAIAGMLLTANTFKYVTEVMRLRFQAKQYLITSAVATLLGSVMGVVAVLVLDLGVTGIFLASILSNALACLYGLAIVRDTIGAGLARGELRTMLRYGLPLVPTTIVAWALAFLDRVILGKLRDLEAVGQFAIASRLTLLIIIGINALTLAMGPFLFNLYSQNPALERAARARTLTYFAFVLSLGALIMTLFAREAVVVLAPNFEAAHRAVGPLAFGGVAYGLAVLLTTGIALARRTVHLAVFSTLAAGVNVALNFLLIPPFGFVGAAFATGAGYAVLAATYYWIGQRVYPTPYEPLKVMTTVTLAASLGGLGVAPLGPAWIAMPAKLAAVLLFVGAVRVTGAMTSAEFAELRRFLAGMLPRRLLRVLG
jgi:O-antigen/teichoic acid export membrane protein